MEVLLGTCARRRVTVLLLLILVVVKAAADCPKPQAGGHTVLTDKSLLLNIFPHGVDVYFECANGYVVESGSGRITCDQNVWTEPDLACKKKDCGSPKAKPNMSFDITAGTLFGAVIKVVCDNGFELSGSSYKQCYAAGWSGVARCDIVSCDAPGEVAHGRSSWDSQDSPKYGEVVHYVCNEGHALIGNSSIVCSQSGEYDSPAPACKAMTSPTSKPAQEVSPSTEASASLTGGRDKTTSATPTVSPSQRGTEKRPQTSPSVEGLLGTARGSDILTAGGKATTTTGTSIPSSSLQDEEEGAVDTNKDIGHVPVIISAIGVSFVVCVLALCLHRFLLQRKGSPHGTVGIY
ncbi:complement decay-accelerating factor, GPI-anchored isoform 2-T3 [Spinachia spinachia]